MRVGRLQEPEIREKYQQKLNELLEKGAPVAGAETQDTQHGSTHDIPIPEETDAQQRQQAIDSLWEWLQTALLEAGQDTLGYKLLSVVLLRRLERYAEEALSDCQAGFRRNRSTTDHIFAVRTSLAKRREFRCDTHLIFVDFAKAYDSVIRSELWKRLEEMNIPMKLITMMKALFRTTRNRVKVDGFLSEDFRTTSGVRQGDALSPLLFNLALETALLRVLRRIGQQVRILAYADDIVLIGETKEQLEEAMGALIEECAEIGLSVNQGKTKALRGILNSKSVWRGAKLMIYEVAIRPVALYGCQSWTLTARCKDLLTTFENQALRQMVGWDFSQGYVRTRSNKEVRELLRYEKWIVSAAQAAAMNWAGHVVRAPEGRFIRQVDREQPEGRRAPGKPRTRWQDYIKAVAKEHGETDWRTLAQDREAWQNLCTAVKQAPPLAPPPPKSSTAAVATAVGTQDSGSEDEEDNVDDVLQEAAARINAQPPHPVVRTVHSLSDSE
ncbi:hypothetical protein FOCC_FOCC011412 [Frankliniella occidentalis]|nr:hypothetical protein FOCC_FOCC011412 [Frankliniella occidentalis]